MTLKTGVMAAENSDLPSHKKITLKIIVKHFMPYKLKHGLFCDPVTM